MRNKRALKVRRVPVARLRTRWIEEMWALYEAHYDHVERRIFDQDLAEKRWVILGLERATGHVRAFSTATIDTYQYRGRRIGVYFSGDTMVHPDYWGRHVLHRAVMLTLLQWCLLHPFRRLYWHLICNGYRTLLTLANNCPHYWPHPEQGLPAWESGLIDRISLHRFGGKWRPHEGVVRDTVRLKSGVAPFTRSVSVLPVVRMFLTRNPGYRDGDELSMIARIDAPFFWKVAAKIVRISLRPQPQPSRSTTLARRLEPSTLAGRRKSSPVRR
jgi:hypothetical protein